MCGLVGVISREFWVPTLLQNYPITHFPGQYGASDFDSALPDEFFTPPALAPLL